MALAACSAEPARKPTPDLRPHAAQVELAPGSAPAAPAMFSRLEIERTTEELRDLIRAGELDRALQHYHAVEPCTRVARDSDAYPARLELENLFVRCVMAREFLALKVEYPGQPGTPPLPPQWPVAPW